MSPGDGALRVTAQATARRAPRTGGTDRVPTLAAAVLLLCSLAAFAVLSVVQGFQMADIHVYRAEGRAVLHGTDLYGFAVTRWELPATYPPFAALLFVPLAGLSLTAAKICCVLGNVALLGWLVRLSLRMAGLPRRLPVLLAVTAGALWLEPVFQTLVFGQINLLLTCLVLWELDRAPGTRGKGLLIGVAAGIKLTPLIFAVHLLLTGRTREGLTAVGGFLGTVLVGVVVLPGHSVEFWTRRIFETSRVGKAWVVDNQSLKGLLARAGHTAEPGLLWLIPAVVLGVAGLLLARSLHRRGAAGRGVLVTAGTALLISPVSWSHHWVWCVPLLAAVAAGAAATAPPAAHRWRAAPAAAMAVVFTARSMWLLPKEDDLDLHLPWWQQPLASPYPLLALGAGLVLAVQTSGSGSGAGLAGRSDASTIR